LASAAIPFDTAAGIDRVRRLRASLDGDTHAGLVQAVADANDHGEVMLQLRMIVNCGEFEAESLKNAEIFLSL
jgi:hypothetical protein